MELSSLEMTFVVNTGDSEQKIDSLTNKIVGLSNAVQQSSKVKGRKGIFSDVLIKDVELINRAEAASTRAYSSRLGAMAKNFSEVNRGIKEVAGATTKTSDKVAKITTGAKEVDNLGDRLKILKNTYTALQDRMRLYANAMKELRIINNELEDAVKGKLSVSAKEKGASVEHKEAIKSLIEEIDQNTNSVEINKLALKEQSEALKLAIKDTEDAIRAKAAYNKEMEDEVRSMGTEGRKIIRDSDKELRDVEKIKNAELSSTRAQQRARTQAWREEMAQREKLKKENLAAIRQEEIAYYRLFSLRMSMMRDMSIVTRQVGTFFSRYFTTAVAGAAAIAVKFTAEMQLQQKAFEILLGSASKGAAIYREVVEYAALTPYQLPELTQATKELLAYGSASGEVMDELRRLGDLAQNDAEKLDSVVQAFGKVQARGVAHMRELNRFIMAGVPIIGTLGEVMNMGMEELFSAVQKGLVSFESVKQAVERLTNEGGRFYNMSKDMSQLVAGRWSTLQDEFHLMLRSFVEDLMPAILKAINYVIDFTQAVQDMNSEQRKTIRTIALVVAALGPGLLLISKLISALMILQKLVMTIKKAFAISSAVGFIAKLGQAIGVAFGGAPVSIAAVITALGALAAWTGFGVIKNKINDTVQGFRDLKSEVKNISKLETPEAAYAVLRKAYAPVGGHDIVTQEMVSQYFAKGDEDWAPFLQMLDEREEAANALVQASEDYKNKLQEAFNAILYTMTNTDVSEVSGRGRASRETMINLLISSGVLPEGQANSLGHHLSTLPDQQVDQIANDLYMLYRKDLEKEMKKGELGQLFRLYLQNWVSKEDLAAIEAQNEMNTAVLEDTLLGEKGPLSFLATMNQKLLASLDVSGYGDISTASGKFVAMMKAYVENTGEAIQDSGARLSKYMADIPGFDKFYDVLFSTEALSSYTLTGRLDKLAESLNPDEKWVYDLLVKYFGNVDEIKAFFAEYKKVVDDASATFLDDLKTGYYLDNIGDVLGGKKSTSEQKKSQAESVIKGIEEQIASFVKSKGPKSLEDIIKFTEEFKQARPDIMEEYAQNLTKFNDALVAVAYEKEFDKLKEGIVTYGKYGEEALRASYSLQNFSEAQIATLIAANQLNTGLASLTAMSDSPSADPQKILDILGAMNVDTSALGEIKVPDISADAKTAIISYFEQLYGLGEAERIAKEGTDTHKRMLDELVKTLGEDAANAMKSSGVEAYLTTMNADLDTQLANMTKTANELLIEELEKIKSATTATSEIIKLADEAIDKLKELDKPVKTPLRELFESELKNIGQSLLQTGLSTMISELEEVGKAFITANAEGRKFGDTVKNIGLAILQALPQLLLQAGLAILPSNLWVGLGLIAASGIAAIGSGAATAAAENAGTSAPIIPASTITYNARGNVYKTGNILSAPTMFRTKSGLGVAGENGPEGILPLGRNASGDLGVIASGMGSGNVTVPVTVNVINETGSPIETETQETTGADGARQIQVLIKKAVSEGMAKGEYDRVMSARYGVKHRGVV